MVTVFGLHDIPDLRSRHDTKELIVVGLLNSLQLELYLVALLDELLTGILAGRLDHTLGLHLGIERTLLLLHFTIQGEEGCCLLRRQTGLFRDKGLHVCLKLFRRELLLRLLGIHRNRKQEEQTIDKKFLHRFFCLLNSQTTDRHRCPDCRSSDSRQPHRNSPSTEVLPLSQQEQRRDCQSETDKPRR